MEEDLLTARLIVLESEVEDLTHSHDKHRQQHKQHKQMSDALQGFTEDLLRLNSLVQVITYILDKTGNLFNFDLISLALIDDTGAVAKCLENSKFDWENHKNLILLTSHELLQSTFNGTSKPYIGLYKPPKYSCFFSNITTEPASIAVANLERRNEYLGALALGSYDPERFSDSMTSALVARIIPLVTICLENDLHFEKMQLSSFVDNLTGANNRRFFEQRIDEELGRAQRNGQPLSCLFLDIDFFKSVNDTYGHQGGDLVLSMVTAAIKTQMRSVDVLARYGGEEFVALLSNINETMALDIAERIRKTVAALNIALDDLNISVTISIGVATYQPGTVKFDKKEIAAHLVKVADTALYKAKHNGRNRVENGGVLSDDTP